MDVIVAALEHVLVLYIYYILYDIYTTTIYTSFHHSICGRDPCNRIITAKKKSSGNDSNGFSLYPPTYSYYNLTLLCFIVICAAGIDNDRMEW